MTEQGIFNWTDETVMWGETVLSVSEFAATENPLVPVLRQTAMKYDDATENVVRYAKQVAADALEIATQTEQGYMTNGLHHQRPSDLNEAVAQRQVLATTLNALFRTVEKMQEA